MTQTEYTSEQVFICQHCQRKYTYGTALGLLGNRGEAICWCGPECANLWRCQHDRFFPPVGAEMPLRVGPEPCILGTQTLSAGEIGKLVNEMRSARGFDLLGNMFETPTTVSPDCMFNIQVGGMTHSLLLNKEQPIVDRTLTRAEKAEAEVRLLRKALKLACDDVVRFHSETAGGCVTLNRENLENTYYARAREG